MTSNSDDTLETEVRQRLEILCTHGKTVEATSPIVDIKQKPEFFNQDRLDRAQKTLQKYYTSTSTATTAGLILLLQLKSILIPLLKTGKSQSVVHLWTRYAETTKYIKTCYETKFYDTSSDGWRYILMIRGMHKRIHELMNKNHIEQLEGDKSNVWVNQYDMAVTQFAFIGLLLLKPKKCAAYGITIAELLDIVYYWRVLSYYFGIEDKFNIFVYDDDWPKQYRLMELVMEEIYRKELKDNRQKVGVEMGRGFLLAFEDLIPDMTFNILEHHWSSYISLSGLNQLAPYSCAELYKLAKFKFVFKVLFRNETMVARINAKYKRKFDKFYANGEKVKKKLAKKYGHLKYIEKESDADT